MKDLVKTLNKMNRTSEDELGIWCPIGGISTSITCIAKETGAKVTFDRPRPSEGCTATLVTPDGQRYALEQHWHGGPASGDWWWVMTA